MSGLGVSNPSARLWSNSVAHTTNNAISSARRISPRFCQRHDGGGPVRGGVSRATIACALARSSSLRTATRIQPTHPAAPRSCSSRIVARIPSPSSAMRMPWAQAIDWVWSRFFIAGTASRLSPTQPECADSRGVGGRILLEIVPHVPDRTVIARIDCGLTVVLPPDRVDLRRLAFYKHGLVQGENTKRIAGQPAGEALTGKIGRAPERIPDADIALAVDGRTRHPAIETVGCVGALLPEAQTAVRSDHELIPAHPATERL